MARDYTGNDDLIVTTDKGDYAPGETAIITAAGLAAGATVEFQVQHVDGAGADATWGTADDSPVDLGGAGHDSWSVVDGGAGDLDGVVNGVVVAEWFVNPDDSLNQVFRVSASDGVTTVFNRFTDGASYDLDQWSNGPDETHSDADGDGWQNGNLNRSNAHYYEGDFVPYRSVVTDLSQGVYFVTIEYDLTERGEYAIDYLGAYDQSFGPGDVHADDLMPDPIAGTGLGAPATSTLEVALNPIVDAGPDGVDGTPYDIAQDTGHFTMFDGTLLGFAVAGPDGEFGTADDVYYLAGADGAWGTGNEAVVHGWSNYADGNYGLDDDLSSEEVGDAVYVTTGDVTGNARQSVTVMYAYAGAPGGDAVLAWGGHIATNADWDDQANPTGSPYHMRMIDLAGFTPDGSEIKVTGTGNQDRSLTRSVIVQEGAAIDISKTTYAPDPDGLVDTSAFAADGVTVLAGSDVIWRYAVTNVGTVDLETVEVGDNDSGLTLVRVEGDDVLNPGETWIYEASGTAVDGGYTNTGWASAVVEGGTDAVTATDDSSYLGVTPSIGVDKSWVYEDRDGSLDVSEGDVVTYTYTVTNTGPVTLSAVTLDDDKLDTLTVVDNGAGNGADVLATGEVQTWTAQYTIGAEDLGETITNIATATGSFADGFGNSAEVEDTATADVYVPLYRIEILKQIKVGDSWAEADDGLLELLRTCGGKVEYQIIVRNTGTETLTDVTVDDDLLGLHVALGDLAVDTEIKLTSAQYDELLTCWREGEVENTATASSAQADDSDSALYTGAAPAISIDKLTLDEFGNVGDGLAVLEGAEVRWFYGVQNEGNVALSNVVVVDDNGTENTGDDITFTYADLLGGDTNGDLKLDVDETWVFTDFAPVIAIPDGDLYASYENTAHVTADYGDGAGKTITLEDCDTSSYTVFEGGFVTDAAFCGFGDNVEFMFFENCWDKTRESYSFFATLPGHNRYNVMFDAAEAGGKVTLNVPFPFVLDFDLDGAAPVTAYSQVTVDDHCGFCLEVGTPLEGIGYEVQDFDAGQYTDVNGNGVFDFGDTYAVTVSGLPGAGAGAGFGMVSILLDYGLEFTQAWGMGEGEYAGDAVNLDPETGLPDIADGQSYLFSAVLGESQDATAEVTITSSNTFKPDEDGCADCDDSGHQDGHKDDRDETHAGGKGGGHWNHVDGTRGDDRGDNALVCSKDADKIRAFKGNDEVSGRGGDDKIFGHKGNDMLHGGAGNDKIHGGAGDDLIVGGSGNDKLWGGKGADTFLFNDVSGTDRIFDFDAAEDILDLARVGEIENWGDLLANHVTNVDKGAWIRAGDMEVFLKGIAIHAEGDIEVHFGL